MPPPIDPVAPAPLLLPSPRQIEMRPDLGFVQISPGLREQVSSLLTKPAAMRAATRIGKDVEFGQSICLSGPSTPYWIAIAPPSSAQAAPVHITAQTDELRRSALHTLLQLLRQYPDRLPALSISDYPNFPIRGVMLDVSRDKVPTMAHLRHTIDLLASLKFNHLQFYTEHTFAYAGHEEVWETASPITPDEIRELDLYASARGIELASNQNCFGHLATWLKRPAYQNLAEIEGNNPWYFHQWERRGPFSLCPTEPKSEAFVQDLLGQLLPCVESPLVNIGCDETFDVGWGRSKAEVDRRAPSGGEKALSRARAQLYFEFVNKIAAACARHNKRPMLWADIALTHPDMLDLLPREAIGLAWWYEPTDKFADWVRLLRQHGHSAWVCPGTSSWRTFTGRTMERRANIADAAEQGAAGGWPDRATGFMVCDWGDMGHRQQWPISLAGIAQAAEAAWNPDRARTFDPRAAALHALHEHPDLGPWLDELGDCDLPIRQSSNVRNASALFNDLHPPVPGQLTHGKHEVNATIEQWQETKTRLTSLIARRPTISDTQTRAELDHTQACALFAADHAIAIRALGTPTLRVGFPDLISRAEAIRAEHERLWLVRNRPGGLAHASTFYTKVIDNLRNLSSGPTAAP